MRPTPSATHRDFRTTRLVKESETSDLPSQPSSVPESQTIEHELGEELLKIHQDSYGKGAASVRVLMEDDAIVVFFDGLELQPNEEFLIEGGHGDSVIAQRGQFQQAIGSVYRAATERVTGRTVTSFASVTKLNPHYAVEIFRLAVIGASSDPTS